MPPRRRIAGWVVAGGGLAVLTALFHWPAADSDLSTIMLLYLSVTVAAATVGGFGPGLATAVASVAIVTFAFTHPRGSGAVEDPRVTVALVVFVAIGTTVSVLVDLTARRAAQAAQAESAVRVNEVRGALLSALSHDLRTPLATIKAWATGLQATDVAFDEAQRAEALAAIVAECDRLAGIVGNLLDASRVRAGAVPLQLTELALDDLVPGALAGLDLRDAAVAVDVPHDLPTVWADAALVERVLTNLLTNAVRHSPPAATVRLRAAAAGDVVAVQVVDRGPGIAATDAESVFAPFQRLGDGAQAGEGLGLGLSVARGLARAMGGDVTIADTPGGGVTATLELPTAASAGEGPR